MTYIFLYIQNVYKQHGGTILDNSPITEIIPLSKKSVQVKLQNGKIIQSKYLVICAGPWTNKLLQPLKYVINSNNSLKVE